MSSSARLSSVCCLSCVAFKVRAPYSGDLNFRQCFHAIWYAGHFWLYDKNFTEIVPGEPNPSIGGVKHNRVAKYSESPTSAFSKLFLERKKDVVARPSVVYRLWPVTFVHATQAIWIFGNVSTPFGTLAISDFTIKILQRSSQGNLTPPSEELNTTG